LALQVVSLRLVDGQATMDGLWAAVQRPLLRVGFLALLVCLLGLAGYLLTLFIWSEVQLRRRALHDYRAARGTQHLLQLLAAVSVLRDTLRDRQDRIDDLEQQLARLRTRRALELHQALTEQLVHQRLIEVKGIGTALSQLVILYCFRGRLNDLHTATRVEGIGPALQTAISAWVVERQAEFPGLLVRGFAGKQRIEAKYAELEASLARQLKGERVTLKRSGQLYDTARAEIARLQRVRLAHVRKALRRRSTLRRSDRGSPVPAWYLKGVYPPWEPMPDWFRTLLDNYGR
jgi:hypothetical protein